MRMQRLTVEDQLMLWPDALWPQEVGALAILDGHGLLDLAGRLRIEAVRAVIAAHLDMVPRFRQLLLVPRRGLGPPLWVDAPGFDITEHVLAAPVAAPGDEAALLVAVEARRRRRLDRSRPLWEMCFLTGLSGDRVALFVRMHHAMGDGIAGIAMLGAFLDSVPDPPAVPPPAWAPRPLPPGRVLFADNVCRRARGLRSGLATLAHPGITVRSALAAWPTVRALLAQQRVPGTSLDRVVGPDRTLALVRSDLAAVKRVAHEHGGTVNDVLLTLIAGGLRDLLHSRGEPVDGVTLPIYVPATLRRGPREQARGNLVALIVPLPVGVADPARRLEQIAAETSEQKAKEHPPLGKLFHTRIARVALLKLLDRQPVSVTSADLPGPQQPLHLAGSRVLEVFPVLPPIAKVSLGVGALSYAGQLAILVVADKDAVPDLDVLAASMRSQLRRCACGSLSHGSSKMRT